MDTELINGVKKYLSDRYGDDVNDFPTIERKDLPDFEKATGLNDQNLIAALQPLKDAGYITVNYGNNQLQEIIINRAFPF